MPVSAELALAIKFYRFPSSSWNRHDIIPSNDCVTEKVVAADLKPKATLLLGDLAIKIRQFKTSM